MEPYRPFVDKHIVDLINTGVPISSLTKDIKAELLKIPVIDVKIEGKRSPLMIAASTTSASLQKCFSGESRQLKYPDL